MAVFAPLTDMSVATEIEFEATDFSSETPKHEAENLAEGARRGWLAQPAPSAHVTLTVASPCRLHSLNITNQGSAKMRVLLIGKKGGSNSFMGSATTVIGGSCVCALDWTWPPGATKGSKQFAGAGGAAGARLIPAAAQEE